MCSGLCSMSTTRSDGGSEPGVGGGHQSSQLGPLSSVLGSIWVYTQSQSHWRTPERSDLCTDAKQDQLLLGAFQGHWKPFTSSLDLNGSHVGLPHFCCCNKIPKAVNFIWKKGCLGSLCPGLQCMMFFCPVTMEMWWHST